MNPTRLRLLQIGCGNFGSSWTNGVLPQVPEAVLTAVCDRNPEALLRAPAGAARYTDLGEALAQGGFDAVLNTTTPAAHLATTAQCLEAGYPVLCEKPIGASLDDAQALLRLQQACGLPVMIAENYRYNAPPRKVKEILDSGRLGAVHALECTFHHDHPDASHTYHGALPQPLIQDVTVHHLDLARYFSGKEPVDVAVTTFPAPYSWYGQRPAACVLTANLTDGARLVYHGSLAEPCATTDWVGRWRIECDQGVLTLEGCRITLDQDGRQETLDLSPSTWDCRDEVLREFIAALREGRPGATDLADNYHSFAFMCAAVEAAACGQWVDIKE